MTEKKLRLFDDGVYLGTFTKASAEKEAARLGGKLQINRERPSHIQAKIVRNASTHGQVKRTNDTPVKVVHGAQNMGVMKWSEAKKMALRNNATLKLTSSDTNPATYTITGHRSSPMKRG